MKVCDVIECAKSKRGEAFANWLVFQMEWEAVLDKNGDIITENVDGDAGGLTLAGVDIKDHPSFPFDNPQPADVVKAYETDWDSIRGDQLPSPIGIVVANYAVNTGPGRAVKLLQMASHRFPSLSPLRVDGWIGPKTMGMAKTTNPVVLAHRTIDAADEFYTHLADYHVSMRQFLKGWMRRDESLSDEVDHVVKTTVTSAVAVNPEEPSKV